MDKSEKIIVRAVAFLISAVISVSVVALFSSWAWTHLDPAQQEAIAAINGPWFVARATPANTAAITREDGAPDHRTVATRAPRTP
jgi:hypothetical protein